MARNFARASSQFLRASTAPVTAYPFSASLWIRPTVMTGANLVAFNIAAGTNDAESWCVRINTADAKVRFRSKTGDVNQDAVSTLALTTGTWYHVFCRAGSATDRAVYVDGANSGTSTNSSTPVGPSTITIGSQPATLGQLYWEGDIAEIAFWDADLGASDEMLALAKGVSPLLIRPGSHAAYWPLLGRDSPEPDSVGAASLTLNNGPVYADHLRMVYPRKRQSIFIGSGGTTTPITPSGSCTPTGSLTFQVNKALAGSSTPTGSLVKLATHPLAGSSTSTGLLTNQARKAAAGSSTGTGSETNQAQMGLAGSLTAAGSLANQAQKGAAGSSTPSGSESNQSQKPLGGSSTSTGSLTRAVNVSLAGSETPTGSLAKQVNKSMDGSTTPTGDASYLKVALLTLTGSVTAVGSLVKSVWKSVTGSATSAGAVTKTVAKSNDGSSTPTGDVTTARQLSLSGAVTAVGSLIKDVFKYLFGFLTPSGELEFPPTVAHNRKVFTGTIVQRKAFPGSIVQRKVFSGTIVRRKEFF